MLFFYDLEMDEAQYIFGIEAIHRLVHNLIVNEEPISGEEI